MRFLLRFAVSCITKTLCCVVILMTGLAIAQASSSSSNSAAKAAAAKRKAQEDELKAHREEIERKVKANLEKLKPYLPNLTENDLRGLSPAGLRDLYYKSYLAQGMQMVAAREKADTMQLDWY